MAFLLTSPEQRALLLLLSGTTSLQVIETMGGVYRRLAQQRERDQNETYQSTHRRPRT